MTVEIIGLVRVHYTAPRRATHLDFVKSPGGTGQSKLVRLIQAKNRGFQRFKWTAGTESFNRFCTPLVTASSKNAVFNGLNNCRSQTVYEVLYTASNPVIENRGCNRFSGVAKVRQFMRFCTPLKTAVFDDTVSSGVQNLINGLTFATRLNRWKPRCPVLQITAVFSEKFFRG